MITPQEAEQRAHDAVEAFVNAAHCRDANDVANVLMKLASMTGLAMAAVVGPAEAALRMQACAMNAGNATVTPKATFTVAGTERPN